jgi:hypothetical protein
MATWKQTIAINIFTCDKYNKPCSPMSSSLAKFKTTLFVSTHSACFDWTKTHASESFMYFYVLKCITVVPMEVFRKMLTNSFPNLKEHLWTIPQQFDKFLKKFLTSCFIDQSGCSKIKIYKIWLVNETGS